ncbi:sugar phosphate isomerase/epimerase family protein [Enterococcus sp.]|uniref:sugar phosphate isomerase/epimerase family protein n=1 Tax=Enterococcus sp. TaxID=35783 RepID=UPI002906F1E8|nr:sugar phosphate isomerase/epimerase family protein [Enterococcus sp.]MDU5336842.1 sugar phosphate isomerase/epimerase family protein [Enterococcus sp.]
MLNLAIRGHDLSNVTTVEALAEKTQAENIQTLQLALGLSFPDWPSDAENLTPGLGQYVKGILQKRDIQVGILSCYINMIHPDKIVREAALTKFESYVRHARYFGATMVATETGNVLPEICYTKKNYTDEAFEEMVQVIQRLVKVGEQHQMLIGIEPGLNHPLYSLKRVEQLLQRIDSEYLGIVLDPTNLITSDTYHRQVNLVEQAFERFGEKIVAFHLKDYHIQNNKIIPVNLGTGMIDYPAICRLIAKKKPGMFVVLEETKDQAIQEAVQLIQQVWNDQSAKGSFP